MSIEKYFAKGINHLILPEFHKKKKKKTFRLYFRVTFDKFDSFNQVSLQMGPFLYETANENYNFPILVSQEYTAHDSKTSNKNI